MMGYQKRAFLRVRERRAADAAEGEDEEDEGRRCGGRRHTATAAGRAFCSPSLCYMTKVPLSPGFFKGAQIPIQTYPDPQQRPGASRRPECCPPASPDPHKAYPANYSNNWLGKLCGDLGQLAGSIPGACRRPDAAGCLGKLCGWLGTFKKNPGLNGTFVM